MSYTRNIRTRRLTRNATYVCGRVWLRFDRTDVHDCDSVTGFIDNDVKLPDVVCDSSVGKAKTS